MSSLAVHVTRERFRRCVSESLSSNGKLETHPDSNMIKKVSTNKNNEENSNNDIKLQINSIIRTCYATILYEFNTNDIKY